MSFCFAFKTGFLDFGFNSFLANAKSGQFNNFLMALSAEENSSEE
jgi:hypothetical protein